jgi:AcrR family transcriptional regulator
VYETKRRGRRPKSMGDTRAAIMNSAVKLFSRTGLDRTSLREIAVDAGVDPALILHYFGSKDGLFLAMVREKMDRVLSGVLGGGKQPRDIGERIVGSFLTVWDGRDDRRLFAALFRTAMTNERFLGVFRDLIQGELIARIGSIGRGGSERRVALSLTQIMGLAIARYVAEVGPIVRLSKEEITASLGPTITRYLQGPMPGAGGP